MKQTIVATLACMMLCAGSTLAADRVLDCSDRTFSLPGVRYMHKIRTFEPKESLSVLDLPEGLVWNERRKLVEGTVDKPGDYTYRVVADADTIPVLLTVSSDLLMPTPMMGWLSWNVVLSNVSESIVRETADALIDKGLFDAGYKWVGLDDDWQTGRERPADSIPAPDPAKFPSGMKALADYLHERGMKFGVYSDAALRTCDNKFGSYLYEDVDARTYADWGVDFVKYDYCWVPELGIGDPNQRPTAQYLYGRMGRALRNSGRDIVFYMCNWGRCQPWQWGHEVDAVTWRATADHRDGWYGIREEGDGPNDLHRGGIGMWEELTLWKKFWQYTGVNRFSDADMLCIGIRGRGKESSRLLRDVAFNPADSVFMRDGEEYLGFTTDEANTEFVMWCMWSSPLMLSLDVRDYIRPDDLATITNPELIAINQDPMGQAAEFIGEDGGFQLWAKDMADGDVVVAVVNMNDAAADYTLDPARIDALTPGAVYKARNPLTRTDEPELSGSRSFTLPAHATKVLRLKRKS
ncbi:MAG: glycoside hydrolase family 27 protein [Muribaculaceae bacterium]|nr:glycoside hydrolase family 27 protein [Muribaculaceae bacterium]